MHGEKEYSADIHSSFRSKFFIILKSAYAGNDRYQTSLNISKMGWPTNSDYAVIATGNDFPDALSAAPLARKYNAPILLTDTNNFDSRLGLELDRLKVKKVFIIGGTGVVSKGVEEKIEAKGIITTRLSIASIAASGGIPILLTDGSKLPLSISNYLKNNNIFETYVIGGNGVVSEGVASQLKNVKRIYGKDRFETNAAVIKNFINDFNFNKLYIATGNDFPDALSGSALAAMSKSPVVLADNGLLPQTKTQIDAMAGNINEAYILGGEDVVPDYAVAGVAPPIFIFVRDKRLIVIDPGHGGSSPGAVPLSRDGKTRLTDSREALLTYNVAQKVKSKLESSGYSEVMTRNGDNYISLEDRAKIANDSYADMFISIHYDSSTSRTANGTSAYYSSYKPYTLYTDQTDIAAQSRDLAQRINSAISILGISSKGVFENNFAVNRLTNMTSVLLELGFISNYNEFIKITQDSFQDQVADKIVLSVAGYYKARDLN